MKLIGEHFSLLALRLKVMIWEARESKKVKTLFYKNASFALLDKALKRIYLFRSAYRISKEFLQRKKSVDIHCYGETPISVYHKIAQEIKLDKHDSFWDLGCGRGRGLFFLSQLFSCKCHGVDWIPEFVMNGHRLTKKYKQDKVKYILSDMCHLDFHGATAIYLFGSSFSDELLETLSLNLSKLPSSVRIITVSFPLTDYSPLAFDILKSFEAEFNWGTTEVFIQTPKNRL